MPESLEPPEITDGFQGWYEDFWRISSERQIGFGVGPIPASAIARHTEGWLMEDAIMFDYCIRRMDDIYLQNANRSGEDKPAITSGPPPRFTDLAKGR